MNINLVLIWNLFFATMVIFCRNSLYSILSLVFLIVGCCFILLMLKVEFLSFILLLIYIGAITVLFLFVVMMLQLDKTEKSITNFDSTNYLIYFLLSFKIICFIFYFSKKLALALCFISFEFVAYNKDIDNYPLFLLENRNDNIIFLSLFSQKFIFFIIIGFTLLFSMVGSIALCLTKK